MDNKLLIVGAGGFGRVVAEHAQKRYECAFVDDGIEKGVVINGIPVIGSVDKLEQFYPEYKCAVVAIGNNQVRKKIFQQLRLIGYCIVNIILDSVYISPYAKIGTGCVFLNNVVIQNGACVGDSVLLNPGVEIHHDSRVEDFVLIYTNSVVRTNAVVHELVKIGSNATITNNSVIETETVVDDGKTIYP